MELHKELYTKKVLGVNTSIISILDGDIESELNKEQKKLPHIFLPIPSLEKFLYSVVKENSNPSFKRIINDKYFIVHSLDEIVSQYNMGILNGSKDNNKNFYKKIRTELENIGTNEQVFITGLCEDILDNIDTHSFIESLRKQLS